MLYGVFNEQGLLEDGFGTEDEANEARDKYNQENEDEGLGLPDCYVDTICEDCGEGDSKCECLSAGNADEEDGDEPDYSEADILPARKMPDYHDNELRAPYSHEAEEE